MPARAYKLSLVRALPLIRKRSVVQVQAHMKKLLIVAFWPLLATSSTVRSLANQAEQDLWTEATSQPDLR